MHKRYSHLDRETRLKHKLKKIMWRGALKAGKKHNSKEYGRFVRCALTGKNPEVMYGAF